jgi:hypothetical protein
MVGMYAVTSMRRDCAVVAVVASARTSPKIPVCLPLVVPVPPSARENVIGVGPGVSVRVGAAVGIGEAVGAGEPGVGDGADVGAAVAMLVGVGAAEGDTAIGVEAADEDGCDIVPAT